MIVVVSYSDDPHADLVEKALEEEGCKSYFRLDLEETLDGTCFTFINENTSISNATLEIAINGDDLKTIWWRRTGKKPTPIYRSEVTEADQVESYWANRWLLESLPELCFPFGHPHRLRAAENKAHQLKVARAAGFRVPDTCITNDKKALVRFVKTQEWVFIKPIYLSIVRMDNGEERSLYASPLKGEKLIDYLENHKGSFCLLCQERVWKKRDVRVMFLPDGKHFACEINSGGLPLDEVDWRPQTMSFTHTEIVLPEEIKKAGEWYLKQFGLTSGSFDFGVLDDGRWMFFECNPNGQWLWLELKTGFELARQVARILLLHHEGNLGSNLDAHAI